MVEEYYLTEKRLRKVKEELEELKTDRLKMIRERNPELLDYHEADAEYTKRQEDMSRMGSRIKELERIIENHILVEPPSLRERAKVHVGARVSVEFSGSVEEFILVGTVEADPASNRVSIRSPVGKALLGKKVGETIVVKTPVMEYSCRILKIRYENS